MSKDKQPPKEEPHSVPGWIVSFSDMVTLLLAFFVLLQTFAHEQDPALFNAGRGSFRRAVSGLGLHSWFDGRMSKPLQDFRSLKYPTETKKDEPRATERIINPRDNEIRRMFRDLQKQMRTKTSDVNRDSLTPLPTEVTFRGTSARLTTEAKRHLAVLANDLKESVGDPRLAKVYVVGFAADIKKEQDPWMISAQRAAAAKDYLKQRLGNGWDLIAWGSGNGSRITRTAGAGGTQVVVAVLALRQ